MGLDWFVQFGLFYLIPIHSILFLFYSYFIVILLLFYFTLLYSLLFLYININFYYLKEIHRCGAVARPSPCCPPA